MKKINNLQDKKYWHFKCKNNTMRYCNYIIILFLLLTTFTIANVNSNEIGKIYSHSRQSISSGQGNFYIVSKEMQQISSSMKRKLNIDLASTNNKIADNQNSNHKNLKINQNKPNSNSSNLSFSEISSLIQNNQF